MKRAILAMTALVFCLCGGAAADIDKGPYMQNVDRTEVQIVFEGDRGGTCRWGLTPSYGNSMNSAYNPINDMNWCSLTGLLPGALYYFDVTSEDESEQGTFVTAPDAGTPFNFVAVGDTRSSWAGHLSVINAILNYNGGYPDLFFNTGDLVADGMDEDQWDDYFEIEEELLLHTVICPVVGNHEIETGFTLFTRWFTTGRYYWFPYGNAVFVVLDTDGIYGQFSAQYNMLLDAMAFADADPNIQFKFIFFHKPAVTTGSHDPDGTILNYYLDVFEQYNVDLVFNGHNHIYEHGLVNGVHYLVSGGGGVGPSGTFAWRDWTVQVESTRHFCSVDVGPASYQVTVRRPDGSILDSFSGDTSGGGFPGETPGDLDPGGCSIAGQGGPEGALNLLVLLAPLGMIGWLRRRS